MMSDDACGTFHAWITGSTRLMGQGVRFVWRERVCHAQRYRTRSR